MIITNAFSLAMLSSFPSIIRVKEVSEEEVKELELESAVGHESTAQLLTAKLGKPIAFNRQNVTLKPGDSILVAQLMGARKEFKEMTMEEIAKYPIKYLLVTVYSDLKFLKLVTIEVGKNE
jgi:hypothetical protein